MEDRKIVELYFQRAESAIDQTQEKYGKYCHHIAQNILGSAPDAEECVNDALLQAWNTIPPQKPYSLSAYLGKITRNFAINRAIHENAQKRSSRMKVVLDEVEEFLPNPSDGGSLSEEIALKDAINRFLASLPIKHRRIFLQRYWYLYSVKEISRNDQLSESNVKIILHRTRIKFKDFLEKEGIQI